MRRVAAPLGLVLCLLLSTLPGRSLSQAIGGNAVYSSMGVPPMSRRAILALPLHGRDARDTHGQDARATAYAPSPAGRPPSAEEIQRRVQEQKRKLQEEQQAWAQVQEEYPDEAYQQALGATPEQWQIIKPRLERVKMLEEEPVIHISVYASSADRRNRSVRQGLGAKDAVSDSAPPSWSDARGSVTVAGGGSGGPSQVFGMGGGLSGDASRYFFLEGRRRPVPPSLGPMKKQVGDVSLGWRWPGPPRESDLGAQACGQLLDAIEAKDPEQMRRQIEAVRQIREQRQAQQRQARQKLREVVAPAQEAKLILMGYLD